MLCFFAMGGLVLAAFDQVPWELHDNSIILGCLSFFVALVMLYDLADPVARQVTDTTQTDNEYTMSQQQPQEQHQTQQQPQPQQSQQSQQPQQHVFGASDVGQVDPSTTNQTNQSNQSNQTDLPVSTQTSETHRIDVTDNSIQSAKPVVKKIVTQSQAVQTSIDPSRHHDIGQNGQYHRSDSIDFVQYQQMPQPQQPVFERVLLPEKKRPTYNKVADPHKAAIIQNVRNDEYIPRETHFDETINYSQMPKYAAVQRHHHNQHQQQQQQQQQQSLASHQNQDYSPSYAPPLPMYKLSRNYEHNDYERPPIKRTVINDYGRSSSKQNIRTMRSDELSRYHDTTTEHFQNQPMMVIRNYGHSTPTRPSTSAATASASASQNIPERRHHHSNVSVYHRNGNNGTRKSGAYSTQLNSRKNGCCGPNTDDEVDFRKMNSAVRPGFVASVAKLWDQRAVENSGEFNTIV